MALVALKFDDLGKAWPDHGVDSPVVPLYNSGNSQCLHWCGWNSAVQLLAGFPGMLKYLEWACDLCPHSLQLHQGLRNQLVQLRELKGTDAVGSVAGLLATIHAAAKKGNLKEMSSRREGGRLIEDVDCFELLQVLCGALHEEFMEVFQTAIPDLPEAASYWASMMSSTQQTRQVCHTRKKACKHKGDPENQQYQAVSVRTAALLHDGGMDQLLCSVLGHYLAAKVECGACAENRPDWKLPALKSVTEQFVRLPVMLLVSVYSQQTHGAGTDINDAVSLKLEQRIELEEYTCHDWSSRMVTFTLKTIVFREGGITSGHFFVALQCAPDRWVIYNSAAKCGPYTLKQIQQRLGGKVYGVTYMRTETPADDDRQSLAEWLDDPAHADAVRMLASAGVNNGADIPPAAAAAAAGGPSTTSEWSSATCSPDSRLPAMWDVAPSSGPQPLVIPSGPSCPPAAPIRPSFGQKTAQTTTATTAHQDKQDTVNGAVAAVSTTAVQFDLADLLSKALTTAQRKQNKKQSSTVSKGKVAGGKLQPSTEVGANPSAAAQAARKAMLGQAVDPDQDAAILEKARQLRAERQAEEALIKAVNGSSATAAAHGCASQPAMDKKAAKQMAALKRAARLALKQAESRAKKAAARQQATADAEVAPQGADQLAPVAEAADQTAAEVAPIDQGAGRDAVKETAAQPTCDADIGPASADRVAAQEPAENGQAVAQEPAGNAAADEKKADDAVTRTANQNASAAAAGQETADKAAATDSSLSTGADTAAPVLKMAAAESSGGKAAADKAAAQSPAEQANAVEQAQAEQAAAEVAIAMPELIAGQQTAFRDATAGKEVTEPVSAEAVPADTTADDKTSAANDAASKGDVQQPLDVAQAVQKTAQPAQEAAQPAQEAAQSAQEAAQPAQEAAQNAQEAAQAEVSQSSGRLTPTKAKAVPQGLHASSTGLGAHNTNVQGNDDPTSDKGLIRSRWSQDAVTVTQAGLPDAEAHIAVDGSTDLPSCGGDASVVQDLLQRSGMCEKEQAMFSSVDRAARQLLQPNEGRESSGIAQMQAGDVIGMSRADNCDGPFSAQPELELSHGQGPPPAVLADVQSRTSTLLLGPVQPKAVSLVHGQGGASGSAVSLVDDQGGASGSAISLVDGQDDASASAVLQRQHSAVGQVHHSLHSPALELGQGQLPASLTDGHTEGQLTSSVPVQPAQEQEQPTAASADGQGKGQVSGMVPVQEPAADSLCQLGNEALLSDAAKVEATHTAQPAGTVQGSDAAEADGSVATTAPLVAAIGGSNLQKGTAGWILPQSAALASGHSSAPQAAQAAAAITSAHEAALHNGSGHDAEPHASPAASTAAMPAPAGAQAKGEATGGGDAVAAAAQAQGAAALAAAAAELGANAVSEVAPQVAPGQWAGLHVAAEAAAHAAQASAAQLAPIDGVGAGIDPAAAAAVPPHVVQAEAGAADPPPPPPPMLPVDVFQASAAQAHVGAPQEDPAASKLAAVRAYHLAADCTAAAGTLATAADALVPPATVPGGNADPIAQDSPAPTAQRASASKGWRPKESAYCLALNILRQWVVILVHEVP
ncbi:hypothetical protein WJX77_001924 [Trebouxia sp. C0004]